jgi:hypothetical protein
MPLVRLVPTKAYRDLPQGTSQTAYSRFLIIEIVSRFSANGLKQDERRIFAGIIEALDDAITANANAVNVDLTVNQISFIKTCLSTINTSVNESFNFFQFERALP